MVNDLLLSVPYPSPRFDYGLCLSFRAIGSGAYEGSSRYNYGAGLI